MPTVPTTYQQTDASVTPNERQLVAPDTSSGFDALAVGLGKAGAATDDYADQRYRTIYMSTNAQTMQSGIGTRSDLNKNNAQYTSLTGTNAIDGQQAALDAIDKIQQDGMKANSGTPLMAKLYKLHTDELFAGARSQVYDHAIQQSHVAQTQALSAQTGAEQDAAAGVVTSPDKFAIALDRVADAAHNEAVFAGLGDATGEYVKGKTGETTYSAIRAAAASKNTALANYINAVFGADKLPYGVRSEVDGLMAPLQLEDRYRAIFQTSRAGSSASPIQDFEGNWTPVAGLSPKTGPSDQAPVATSAPGQPGELYQSPVAGGHVTQTFAQHVANGEKGGYDIGVPLNTPIKPIASGVVIPSLVGQDGDSGHNVWVKHPDGNISTYSHMGTVSVQPGDQVNANSIIGAVGLTGHTTGPHLHLRVRNAQGVDIDPATLLGGKAGVIVAATNPNGFVRDDETQMVARINAMDLPAGVRDGAISYARQQMRDEKQTQTDTFGQAKEAYGGWIANYALAHGGNYPGPNDVPASIWANMNPNEIPQMKMDLVQGQNAASDKVQATAQSTNNANMKIAMYSNPAAFAQRDLTHDIGNLSATQYNDQRVEQAKIRAQLTKPVPFDFYKQSSIALQTYRTLNADALPAPTRMSGLTGYKDTFATMQAAMLESIRTQAEASAKQTGKTPSRDDMQGFARNAAGNVSVPVHHWFGAPDTVRQEPMRQITVDDIPAADKTHIIATAKKYGMTPTDDQIVNAYIATRH